jgi:hypothetical protein
MRRTHALAMSLLLGAAVAAGAAASLRTVHLGAAAAATPSAVPDKTVAARRAKLARWSVSLRKARAARPPALPAVPHYAPVAIPAPVAAEPSSPTATPVRTVVVRRTSRPATQTSKAADDQGQVTYVQPPPIVQYQQAPAPAATTTTTAWSGEDESSDGDRASPTGHDDGGSGGDSERESGGDG